jgi:O-methyltransferase involved in polyketide biosynthesis
VSYLTQPAVERTLALLRQMLASRSELVFTYMHKGALNGSRIFRGAGRWRSWVRFSGEPFVFGFDPEMLRETLRRFGFSLRSDESREDIARRYCPPLRRNEPGSEADRVSAAIRTEG